MPENAITPTDHLLSPSEAASSKGLTIRQFIYHMARPGAPKPVFIGKYKHPFYDEAEIAAWQPNLQPQKGRR